MCGLVHLVIALWLEEEMAGLPRHHINQPANKRAHGRVLEHHDIGNKEAEGAHKMERLVDPAVMVIAVVIPTLHSQSLQKAAHAHLLASRVFASVMACYGDSVNAM